MGGSVSEAPNTLSAQYTYFDVGTDKTTTLLKSMSVNGLTNYHYTYDALGNIQSVYDGSTTTTYAYDELNQLVRVNDPVTQQTHTYEYQNGNILFDHLYDYTEGELPVTPKRSEQYFYENSVWGDMLTGTATVYYSMYGRSASKAQAQSVSTDETYALAKRLLGENCRVKQMPESLLTQKSANQISAYSANTPIISDRMDIESDEIGNPIYFDGISLGWNGRQLQSITDEYTSITYAYNTDGQRVRKVISANDSSDAYTYAYYYNGSILAGQKVTKTENGETTEYTLSFMYDNNSDVFGFTYNGEPYYYVKNAQNDVTLIMNADGVAVVLYQYDAWGNVTQCFDGSEQELSAINPLLYRSYYYDMELGMYYLNSRYYFPTFHRFLNADGFTQTGQGLLDKNMFAYCGNNPVNRIDSSGKFWGAVAAIVLVAVGIASTLGGCSRSEKPKSYSSPDEAAKAFSESVYSSSIYIRHEYSTEIYSRTKNGITTYSYNTPHSGNPHNATVGKRSPRGTTVVAYAHTHPNSNNFSTSDIQVAKKLQIDAYVVGPNLELQCYSFSENLITNLGGISPIELTEEQKASLVTEFRVSWDSHIADGCDFGCDGMQWPTP